LVKKDGKVALAMDGTDFLRATNTITGATSVFLTAEQNTAADYVLDGTPSGGSRIAMGHRLLGGTNVQMYGTTGLNIGNSILGERMLFYGLYNATSSEGGVSGSTALTGSTGSAVSITDYTIGARYNGANVMDGTYQEAIIYNSDKSSDRTQIESNIGDYFTQNTPLLDTYSGAAAAYSLRKLNSSYTGAAIEVYAGTNGTADIGFNVFGELDTVALAAHCGNQDGTVQTWYDQSGNGNHATQGNTGSQPKIYDGATTSVVTEGSAGNEKPAVEFDGTSSRMTSSMTVTSDFTTSVVLKALTASQSNQWLLQDTSGSDMLLRHRSTNYDFYDGTTTHIIGTAGTDQHHIFITANTSGSVVSFDGADQSISGILNNGYTDLEIGGDSGSRWWHGRFQEIVIYGSYEAANRAGIETNINTFYNIY
jgi:hypothetical protein